MKKKELEKSYEAKKFEDNIYKKWEESGYFNPDNLNLPEEAPTYTIILPPPNITDKLHVGHASMLAIEDLLIRYHRMLGFRTLWLPGTDHAAIATQNVVEKRLLKEQGLTRHDFGREKFLEKVWEFLKQTQSTILNQTRKMGSSLDWSRVAFTLDETRAEAVKKMFVDMYEAGVIYRGERIVNWCPRCHSTLSDDEVEHKEQKAILYTFKYDKNFPIAISTTRPETKLGDTAVAVNLRDKRYKDFIGQELTADFCGLPLKIKIIADRNVDATFGTGALGVTPAHSMVDWQMAEQNNLEIKKVINEDGKIRDGFESFSGKTVIEAREEIVRHLREAGLMIKEEEIDNNLSVCYRCDSAIEPLPSKQWFVSVDKKIDFLGNKSLKEKSIEVAENGSIKFVPERFTKRYFDWMTNMHDWCISRQIWFGHRIPVWYRPLVAARGRQQITDNRQPSFAEASEGKQDEVYVGVEAPEGDDWAQDPDTLDTWFSSGMWTFSTLGWPASAKASAGKPGKIEKSGDLARFHPTQVLETGYEILTLWVSRMIMMSLFAVQEIPFENVYLHGMVLDKFGKKMSKSKGNGIDPLEVIEKYGTDAVRLSMLIGNTPGNDVRISEEKIEGNKNLINKIWNIARYINQKSKIKNQKSKNINDLSLADIWILEKMRNLIKETREDIKDYKFSQAGERLRDFTWNDLADWYLEVSKFEPKNKPEILNKILFDLLKLWHPFIPFVTEVIWQETSQDKLLMIEKYPSAEDYSSIVSSNDLSLNNFELVKEIISAIRNARSENKVEPSRKVKAVIVAGDKKDLIESQAGIIKGMRTGIFEIEVIGKWESGSGDEIKVVVGEIEIYLIGAIDKEKEEARVKKEKEKLEKLIANYEAKLANKEFVDKAPEKVVNEQKTTLIKLKKELENINN